MGQGLEGERVGVEKEDLGELRQAKDVKLGEDESEVVSTCRKAGRRWSAIWNGWSIGNSISTRASLHEIELVPLRRPPHLKRTISGFAKTRLGTQKWKEMILRRKGIVPSSPRLPSWPSHSSTSTPTIKSQTSAASLSERSLSVSGVTRQTSLYGTG